MSKLCICEKGNVCSRKTCQHYNPHTYYGLQQRISEACCKLGMCATYKGLVKCIPINGDWDE